MVTDAERSVFVIGPWPLALGRSPPERGWPHRPSSTREDDLACCHASIDRTSSRTAGILCRSRDGDQSVDLDGPDL